MSWCEKVNAIRFCFDDVWRYHGALAKEHLPPEDARGTFAFSTRFFGGNQKKAMAFSLRMDAFVRLFSSDERLQAWTLPVEDDGSVAVQEPVFHALAICPLRPTEDTLRFDADEFLNLVLGHAYQAGAA